MKPQPALDSTFLAREERRTDPDAWSDSSADGIVATAHFEATRIAADVLGQGGNAVDAAVAASLALGVCEPAGSGLGGMAIFLIHQASAGRTFVVEGSCRAPVAATPEAVDDSHRYRGHRAVATPTNAATLAWVHERYGSLPVDAVVEPAARLADEGFLVTSVLAGLTSDYAGGLSKESGGRLYLKEGQPLVAGERFRNPELAATLRALATDGLASFYSGRIARGIVDDMRDNGGFVSADDLSAVPWPTEREPLMASFGEYRVASTPPPGGGVTLLEMLRIMDRLGGLDVDPDSAAGAAVFAETMRRARLDRRRQYKKVQDDASARIEDLIDDPAIDEAETSVRARLDEPGETTHVSVVDRHGNAVALTQSIERSFGSKVAPPGLGFVYNGYLRAFKVKAKRHPHYLRPGTLARSNASPTIALGDGAPVVALGCSGSERMASSILLTLCRVLRGTAPFDAVAAPRYHCTPEGLLLYEDRLDPSVLAALRDRGFDFEALGDYSFKMGGLQLVAREGDDRRRYTGVGDPRRDGAGSRPRS